MHIFRDAKDFGWELNVNSTTLGRVQKFLDVKLLNLFTEEMKPWFEFVGDIVKATNVLFVLVEDQAKAAGVTDMQFGERMNGDAYEQACEMLALEIIDFFPKSQRMPLRQLLEKSKAAMELVFSRADKELTGVTPEQIADKALETFKRTLNGKLGSSPESSAVTPASSLSGNST